MMTALIDNYVKSSLAQPTFPLTVRSRTKVYPWVRPSIYISNVPYILTDECSYKYILVAKKGQPYEHTVEETRRMQKGTDRHTESDRILQKAFGATIFKKEEMQQELLRVLEPEDPEIDMHLLEQPLAITFQGVMFRARMDHSIFRDGKLLRIDEWKFTNKGIVQEGHLTQAEIYAYMVHKLLDLQVVKYAVLAFKEGEVSREGLRDALESGDKPSEPHSSACYLYQSYRRNIVIERKLQKVVDLFTGKTICRPYPGFDCNFCKASKDCRYAAKECMN